MQNNQNNNSDKSQYVDNATFVKKVLKEDPNINSGALQKAISRLKQELFNGKAEHSVDLKERQKFSEERQKLADKYKKKAIISLERKEGKYVSNADFLKKVCTENPNVNSVALQMAISRLKKRCFNGKSEYSVDPKERQKFSKERQKLADKYTEQEYVSNADFLKKVCTENPNINKSHMLMFKRKRNKKEKSSGQPTNEEVIKEIIGEYNLKPLKYTSKKGKGTTMSRPDAIEGFLKKHPLQEGKQQTIQQINNNINLEEENNDINLEEKNNDLKQVGCKNMNTDNYEVEKKCYNDVEDLEEKSDDFYQIIKKNMNTDDYEVEKKCYNDVEDLEEKSDDFSQVDKRNMEKMYGPEMSENNFKYINNDSSSTKKISNNLENNLK